MEKKYKKIGDKNIILKDKMSGYDKKIILKTFRLPNGVIENFFINDDSDSVQILPVTTDNKIITVSQYRPGLERINVELPGGGIEKGEDNMKAADRELGEETGYSGEIIFLGKINYSPYSTGSKYLFVAKNCERVGNLDLDDNEFLSVVKWPLGKFKEVLIKGKIRGVDCAYMGLDTLGLL